MLNSSCYKEETSCKEQLKWNAELYMSTEVLLSSRMNTEFSGYKYGILIGSLQSHGKNLYLAGKKHVLPC